jgi:hypothetical protein
VTHLEDKRQAGLEWKVSDIFIEKEACVFAEKRRFIEF